MNLSSWDTSKVKSAVAIFQYAGRNSEKFSLDLSNWNTSNVTAMNNMFASVGTNATTFSIIIPQTNSNGINNTNTIFYVNTTDCSITAPLGREFILAIP